MQFRLRMLKLSLGNGRQVKFYFGSLQKCMYEIACSAHGICALENSSFLLLIQTIIISNDG